MDDDYKLAVEENPDIAKKRQDYLIMFYICLFIGVFGCPFLVAVLAASMLIFGG